MNRVHAFRDKLMSRKGSFLADQCGAVSFEMPFVFFLMIMSFLLPLADVATASMQYISAMQALRAFGQSIQYSPPPDLSDTTSWQATAIAKADSKYPISSMQLICGDAQAACSATNTDTPKYYSYQTSFTLSPMVLSSALCKGGNCTITLSYRERFQ